MNPRLASRLLAGVLIGLVLPVVPYVLMWHVFHERWQEYANWPSIQATLFFVATSFLYVGWWLVAME